MPLAPGVVAILRARSSAAFKCGVGLARSPARPVSAAPRPWTGNRSRRSAGTARHPWPGRRRRSRRTDDRPAGASPCRRMASSRSSPDGRVDRRARLIRGWLAVVTGASLHSVEYFNTLLTSFNTVLIAFTAMTELSTSSSWEPGSPASAPPGIYRTAARRRATRFWRAVTTSAAPGTCSSTRASAPTRTCTRWASGSSPGRPSRPSSTDRRS